MKMIFLLLLGMVSLGFCEEKAERPMFYPFDVTVGGDTAVMGEWGDLFAVIEEPVKADAVLEIAEVAPMLIVNAFPCKEDGTILMDGAPAAILYVQNTNAVKLDATLDGKVLTPGTYLMNVVAHNRTSRVVFTVGEKDKIKLPDFGKLMNFLKGK